MLNRLLILFISYSAINGQTEAQLQQARDYIKNAGLTDDEVRRLAKNKGATDEQIKKVISTDDKNLFSKNSLNEESNFGNNLPGGTNTIIDSPLDNQTNNLIVSKNLKENLSNINKTQKIDIFKTELHFGYDIFDQDPGLFQSASVGFVDPDYLIGPGDEIIVMLWGETQFRQVLTVNREGFIFMQEIGQIFVNGLNLSLLESKLFKVLSQSYASLNTQGRKATTFLDVSLGNLRPLRIQVLGEVVQPGAYVVSPSATLFSSLYYFNGPTVLGSLRDIRLIRGNKIISSIDFYDYLLTGERPNDQRLQLDDVIFIPKRKKTVTINGEVNRPGIYEMKPDETLNDLIKIAAGLKITAYTDRAQIDRIVPFEERDNLDMDRIVLDVDLNMILNAADDFELKDGDIVDVFSVFELRQNYAKISGAITRPGNYELSDLTKLSDIIKKADGLTGDAYNKRIDILRTKKDFTKKLIKIDLNDELNNDIILQSLDEIKVYGMSNMVPENYVTINGHVKNPGRYRLDENMRLYDLIFQAGGFLDEKFIKETYLGRLDIIRFNQKRDSQYIIPIDLGSLIENQNQNHNLLLNADDEVVIYPNSTFKSTETVNIDGSVNSPGSYVLKKNMCLKDLILEAGGIINDVHRYRVEIARINPLEAVKGTSVKIYRFEIENDNEVFKYSKETNKNDDLEFLLAKYDNISIRPDPYFNLQRKVNVEGAVYYPGTYMILNENERLSSVIERAGGLKENAFAIGSNFTRDNNDIKIDIEKILKKPNSKHDIRLQHEDQIRIAYQPNLLEIIGEISAPGFYKFNKGQRVRDIINSAGGLTPRAEIDDIFITYPNGLSKKYKGIFKNPRVIDGSVITVGKKLDEEPFNATEYAKDVTTIIANLAEALALVLIANR